ncbi:hypothetical protein FB451DRAFT_722387 [Mycena latifolia]|nr:hypothetical protein FB451DRAFT_722387 [Mycena latifolia]
MGYDVQQEILCLLAAAVTKCPMLRILIASRPEPQISQVFKDPGMTGLYHLLDIGPSFMDIRNYLLREFDRIHCEHEETMASVPTPWPTQEIFEVLVDKSSGYFIYAATIIKFIDDRDFRPTERLAAVVKNLPTECGTPFHALDELYSQILRDTPFQSRLLDILCVIVHGSMLQLSTENIEKLLGLDPGDVKLTLRRLLSLLLVPQNQTHFICLHHKSFRDFLLDSNRSGKFHLGPKQCKDLARSILRALSHSPAKKARPSLNCVGWVIGYSGLEYITSVIPPSVDLLPLIQAINFDFLWHQRDHSGRYKHAKQMINWLKKCSPPPEDLITLWEDCCFLIDGASIFNGPITVQLSDATCHAILSQSPGLLRILQALWVWGFASCKVSHLRIDDLLDIRFLLHMPWDELWAIVRASHVLMGGRSIEKLSILLRFTLQSTTICPEGYPWPSTCRDLARGCTRLLLDEDGLPSYRRPGAEVWSQLVRLSPACDDLLTDIRNLWPSPETGRFYIHNVLEWLKIFPQPPLDVTERWQKCLEECRRGFHQGTSYCPTFKECEEEWIEFRKQMASRRRQEIRRWNRRIVACRQS